MLRVSDPAGSMKHLPERTPSYGLPATTSGSASGKMICFRGSIPGLPSSPVNASDSALPPNPHDSGPQRLVKPSVLDSFIPYHSPALNGASLLHTRTPRRWGDGVCVCVGGVGAHAGAGSRPRPTCASTTFTRTNQIRNTIRGSLLSYLVIPNEKGSLNRPYISARPHVVLARSLCVLCDLCVKIRFQDRE